MGQTRRIAFFAWGWLLALTVGGTFLALTPLTVGLWLVDRNADTTPVTDLGFFALGGVIIASGYLAQLRAPERHIAGLQQATSGLLALAFAGQAGQRVEPLTGAVILLAATALLVALHPARAEFFRPGARKSAPLTALALLAAIPAIPYAATMLARAREAGPSCFLGRCAYGDRFAELAALAIAIVAVGLLAASGARGWRGTAWSVGVAAAIAGVASVIWPGLPGAFGQVAGVATILWGMLFVAVAEREARGTARDVSHGDGR